MNVAHVRVALRKSAPWLIVAALVIFAVYRVKFAPVPVLMVEAQPGTVVAETLGTGTLEARISTIISTRIPEHLAEVLVDEGDAVAAGQLLARLDDGELRLQVEVAEAMLAGARATAERVRVDELRAEAVEEQARQNHQRVTELTAQQVSSTAERDKAIELLRVAESDLQRARAATLEARQQVVTAEKNLAYQQERLGFATIVSPYDGLITRRDRDPGGVVVPGASLLQLVSTNELWISAWVDETAASVLGVGQPARVVFRSLPDRNYPGEVARLGRETDRETREFLVDVRVQELPPNWTVGQRAEVYIETGRKADTLALPQRFLHWRNGQPGVFVATDGRARWSEVRPGLRGQAVMEIVEGLTSGDQVVMPTGPKQPPLRAGQRITAK